MSLEADEGITNSTDPTQLHRRILYASIFQLKQNWWFPLITLATTAERIGPNGRTTGDQRGC